MTDPTEIASTAWFRLNPIARVNSHLAVVVHKHLTKARDRSWMRYQAATELTLVEGLFRSVRALV